ncbi:hypothetical protein ACIQBJ_13020 [Kitasatospora sp. NPDC088391]|uniref:hypothetical protein n=1 Tax=Kitasatospora sp. NPDC088391 TaxID=3364074 RepID=UPI0037F9E781
MEMRKSAVFWSTVALSTGVGAGPYLLIALPAALDGEGGVARTLAAIGLITGVLPGLATGAALTVGKPGAPTRGWPLRAALVTGPVFFTEYIGVAGCTGGPAFAGVALLGTPIAMTIAALWASSRARAIGGFAWTTFEDATRLALIARGKARQRACP